jgi:hypothetical protein
MVDPRPDRTLHSPVDEGPCCLEKSGREASCWKNEPAPAPISRERYHHLQNGDGRN